MTTQIEEQKHEIIKLRNEHSSIIHAGWPDGAVLKHLRFAQHLLVFLEKELATALSTEDNKDLFMRLKLAGKV